jgi:hypothetical protein
MELGSSSDSSFDGQSLMKACAAGNIDEVQRLLDKNPTLVKLKVEREEKLKENKRERKKGKTRDREKKKPKRNRERRE